MIQFDEHIFQRGWNHQLGSVSLIHETPFIIPPPESNSQRPLKMMPGPKRKRWYSNHPFSIATLGLGRVFISDTPRKINMEPKNHPIEKENHLNPTIIFRFHVNLPGCIIFSPNLAFHSGTRGNLHQGIRAWILPWPNTLLRLAVGRSRLRKAWHVMTWPCSRLVWYFCISTTI